MELLSLQLHEDDGGRETVSWTGAQPDVHLLERLIATLVLMREAMLPPVRQDDPVAGESLSIVAETRWRAWRSFQGELVLSLRHPGLGWLHFHLSIDPKNDLHRRLLELLEPSPFSAVGGRPH